MGKYREVTSADHLGRRKAPFREVITKTSIQTSKFLNKVNTANLVIVNILLCRWQFVQGTL
jgi:hypothetical protein